MKLCIVLFVAVVCSSAENVDEFDIDSETIPNNVVVGEDVDDFPYSSPVPSDTTQIYLAEHFDNEAEFHKLWVKSQAKKEGIAEDIAKYDGEWALEAAERLALQNDKGLVLKSKAKHAAISARLVKPFVFTNHPLIVQYEVTFQSGQECGGAYLKLLTDDVDSRNLIQFHDKTAYTIMFGPDKCGTDHKLHFIFRHRNPKNGSIEEKHCQKPKERLDDIFTDHLPHLFTLIVNPDNSYEVQVDSVVFNAGSLLEDFTPPVNPPAEIDDPHDKKPADWDEREKIPDPEQKKPDEWDEHAPAQIVDQNAVMPDGWLESEPKMIPDMDTPKPTDWDTEIDGEWEPPLVENPACVNAPGCGKWEPPMMNNPDYKGKWKAPLVDNPNYRGKWHPRSIPNPDFYEDKHPYRMQTIAAVGFELWSMSENILFDNIIITSSQDAAAEWAAATFGKKRAKITRASESVFERLAAITNEYPVLWGLYIVLLAIPVLFVLYLCCKPRSTSDENEGLTSTTNKKTDDPIGDDDPVRGIAEEEAEDEEKEKYSGDEDDENQADDDGDDDEKYKEVPKTDEPLRKRKARKE